MWAQIDTILALEEVSLPMLVGEIDHRRLPGQTLAQALRLFAVMYFNDMKTLMTGLEHNPDGVMRVAEPQSRQPNFLIFVLNSFATNLLRGVEPERES